MNPVPVVKRLNKPVNEVNKILFISTASRSFAITTTTSPAANELQLSSFILLRRYIHIVDDPQRRNGKKKNMEKKNVFMIKKRMRMGLPHPPPTAIATASHHPLAKVND